MGIAGAGNGGGLMGQNTGSAGNVTNAYWDMDTSGLTTDNSPSGTTGLHTAALQGTLPTGFSATVWGTGANRYPEFLYLGNPAADHYRHCHRCIETAIPSARPGSPTASRHHLLRGQRSGLYIGNRRGQWRLLSGTAAGYLHRHQPAD